MGLILFVQEIAGTSDLPPESERRTPPTAGQVGEEWSVFAVGAVARHRGRVSRPGV